MKLSPLLQRLVDRARLPTMMRAALERAFDAATLDRWFGTVAQQGLVDELANARMAKRRRMRWSPRGAHCVATVRAAVLDGRLSGSTLTRFAA